MKSMIVLAFAVLAAGTMNPVWSQPRCCGACGGAGQSAIAASPVVEMTGKITRVQMTPGSGMPFLEVSSNGQTSRVYLGAMRYLVKQGFSPSAGDEVKLKAYKTETDLYGISVTLVAQDKTIRLRDENGFPLWRGGGRWR
jgi:hypothetical protein